MFLRRTTSPQRERERWAPYTAHALVRMSFITWFFVTFYWQKHGKTFWGGFFMADDSIFSIMDRYQFNYLCKKTLSLTCQQNEPGTLNLALWISAFLTKIHLYRMFKHKNSCHSFKRIKVSYQRRSHTFYKMDFSNLPSRFVWRDQTCLRATSKTQRGRPRRWTQTAGFTPETSANGYLYVHTAHTRLHDN